MTFWCGKTEWCRYSTVKEFRRHDYSFLTEFMNVTGSPRRQRSLTSITTCVAPQVQHLRRPMLRSCRSTAMELATNQSKAVSQSGTIQAFITDIPV